jgi:hypothetical protein
MAWLRISLTDEEQQVVEANRHAHPSTLVRRRLLVLWSLDCGPTRQQASVVTGVGLATTGRIVSLYRREGISGITEMRTHQCSRIRISEF